MAKLKAPAQSPAEDPKTEGVTAPDLSGLIQSLSGEVANLIGGELASKKARLGMVVLAREAREEHGEAVSRDDIRLALQTAVAEGYGLKLSDVQNKPDKVADNATKDTRDKFARRNSCYTLVSELLAMAWPKDEKQDKAVGKAITEGEERWVVLKAMAQKKQTNRADADPNKGKITKENFAAQFNLFLTKAQTDMGVSLEETFELTDIALEAMKNAPK